MDNDSHVLLSSFDETVIQHGALPFNLGLHKYREIVSALTDSNISVSSIVNQFPKPYIGWGCNLSEGKVFISHET